LNARNLVGLSPAIEHFVRKGKAGGLATSGKEHFEKIRRRDGLDAGVGPRPVDERAAAFGNRLKNIGQQRAAAQQWIHIQMLQTRSMNSSSRGFGLLGC